MSDASLEQVERQTAAARSPVHAEDLRPISGAEAARRTTFDGQSLPSMPARRRVIPAPFARPSVRGGSHGKTWQRVRADEVRAGDIVPDVGLVALVHERLRRETVAGRAEVATRVEFVLTGAGGVIQAFSPGEQVQVFRSLVRAWLPRTSDRRFLSKRKCLPWQRRCSARLRPGRSSTRSSPAWRRTPPRSRARYAGRGAYRVRRGGPRRARRPGRDRDRACGQRAACPAYRDQRAGAGAVRPSQFRVSPGTCSLAPVRVQQIPDDWMCTWVYRLVRGDGRQVTGGFWGAEVRQRRL